MSPHQWFAHLPTGVDQNGCQHTKRDHVDPGGTDKQVDHQANRVREVGPQRATASCDIRFAFDSTGNDCESADET